jgi:hypothetical protein
VNPLTFVLLHASKSSDGSARRLLKSAQRPEMPKELFAGSRHFTPYIPEFGISKSYGMMVKVSICWSIAVSQIFPFTVLCILRLEQCEYGRAPGDCRISWSRELTFVQFQPSLFGDLCSFSVLKR